jgi:uncharacterized DUF497 family protein
MPVKITFDAAKNERNIAIRGISFELTAVFEWDAALVVKDARLDYGERRYQALGLHTRETAYARVHPASRQRSRDQFTSSKQTRDQPL